MAVSPTVRQPFRLASILWDLSTLRFGVAMSLLPLDPELDDAQTDDDDEHHIADCDAYPKSKYLKPCMYRYMPTVNVALSGPPLVST